MNEYNRKFEKLKNKEIVWFVYNIIIFYDLFFLKTFIRMSSIIHMYTRIINDIKIYIKIQIKIQMILNQNN